MKSLEMEMEVETLHRTKGWARKTQGAKALRMKPFFHKNYYLPIKTSNSTFFFCAVLSSCAEFVDNEIWLSWIVNDFSTQLL